MSGFKGNSVVSLEIVEGKIFMSILRLSNAAQSLLQNRQERTDMGAVDE